MTVSLDGDLKFFYEDHKPGDIKIPALSPHLVQDVGLETSVLISLFTDARANENDILPDVQTTRRGWWGDALMDSPIGSKRWLMERSKINGETLQLLAQYDRDALQWMIDDGVADRVETEVTRVDGFPNRLHFQGKIIREDNANVFFEYFLNWQNQLNEV